MSELIEKAREFAIEAHEAIGQTRKYTKEPYYNHVVAVSEIVRTIPEHTAEMVAAALLHDTVEDTPVTMEQITEEFGETVAQYVFFLTNTKDKSINRAARKAIDIARLVNAPNEVKTIKLADIAHNTGSIVEHDPGFARRYLQEAQALLEQALIGGNSGLYEYVQYIVKTNLEKVNAG